MHCHFEMLLLLLLLDVRAALAGGNAHGLLQYFQLRAQEQKREMDLAGRKKKGKPNENEKHAGRTTHRENAQPGCFLELWGIRSNPTLEPPCAVCRHIWQPASTSSWVAPAAHVEEMEV